jgi:succinate dehydrogenase/fumarate reductase-like Fe-S protein
MGTCFECRVRVNGIERLACITPVSAALECSGND